MHLPRLAQFVTALVWLTVTQAGRPRPGAHIETCHDGEGSNLHCYNGKDDIPQNVDIKDIAEAGQALRNYGREEKGGRFLTMTAANAADCAEWTIFELRTVLVLAKHIGSEKDSSVLFEDIARTIADEPVISDESDQKPIISCLTAGGSLGVRVNETNPAYKSDDYKKSGYTPDGIIIKIVSNVRKVDL